MIAKRCARCQVVAESDWNKRKKEQGHTSMNWLEKIIAPADVSKTVVPVADLRIWRSCFGYDFLYIYILMTWNQLDHDHWLYQGATWVNEHSDTASPVYRCMGKSYCKWQHKLPLWNCNFADEQELLDEAPHNFLLVNSISNSKKKKHISKMQLFVFRHMYSLLSFENNLWPDLLPLSEV